MKNLMYVLIAVSFWFLHSSLTTAAASPIGTWATVDDVTGKVKSNVVIFEYNGRLYGKISKIMVKPESDVCVLCTGSKKDKPLIGLVIMEGLSKDGDEWSGGTITDPKNGKTYKCTIRLESADKLKVRGYVGFSLLGRTQNWVRVK